MIAWLCRLLSRDLGRQLEKERRVLMEERMKLSSEQWSLVDQALAEMQEAHRSQEIFDRAQAIRRKVEKHLPHTASELEMRRQ